MKMFKKTAGSLIAGFVLLLAGNSFAAAAAAKTDIDPEVIDVKNRTRIAVNSGKDLKKEFYKFKNRNGSFWKQRETAKTAVVKIRNMTDKKVDYAVDYYFIAEPYGEGKAEVFDYGSKKVSCEPNHNVELEITSKTAIANEKKPGASAPKQKNGVEVDAFMIVVKTRNTEIYAFNSRHSDKYDKIVREMIGGKEQTGDDKVKVKVKKK